MTMGEPIEMTAEEEEQLREQLRHDLPVLYTKNEEVNREREYDLNRTVDWIISEFKKGPIITGTTQKLPEYTWLFGCNIWQAERNAAKSLYPLCAICGDGTKEIHHIRPRQLRGSDHPRNLIGLCSECHDNIHRKIVANVTSALDNAMRKSWNDTNHDYLKTVVRRRSE